MKTRYFAVPLIVFLAGSFLAAPQSRAAVDYGDGSSATLTAKAWAALGSKNYADTIAYTSKCIESYQKLALDQQKTLATAKKTADKANWALNDVATCYYIQGMAKEGLNKMPEAMADYKYLVDNLTLAQCLDGKGFSWNPATPAKERLGILMVDHKTSDVITKIDLDTITVKTAAAVSTYRITTATKIQFKGQPANLTDIKIGMAVTVTPAPDARVAAIISADDPPRK
jgi:hypothetical protein